MAEAPQPEPTNVIHFLDYWRVIRPRKEIILSVIILVILTFRPRGFFGMAHSTQLRL